MIKNAYHMVTTFIKCFMLVYAVLQHWLDYIKAVSLTSVPVFTSTNLYTPEAINEKVCCSHWRSNPWPLDYRYSVVLFTKFKITILVLEHVKL